VNAQHGPVTGVQSGRELRKRKKMQPSDFGKKGPMSGPRKKKTGSVSDLMAKGTRGVEFKDPTQEKRKGGVGVFEEADNGRDTFGRQRGRSKPNCLPSTDRRSREAGYAQKKEPKEKGGCV